VEIEAGGEADRNRDRSSAWLAPLYVKVGLSARAQLGVLGTLAHPTGRGAAFGDLALAMKYRLADGVPLIGTFAVQPGVKLPTGDADHGTRTSDVSVLLIGSRAVGSVALDVNAGYTRRSGDGTRAPRDATLWTLSAGIPLPKGVGIAAELFGMPGTRGPAGAAPTVAMLAGPTFPLGAHGVLDVGGIVRVAGPQPDALYAGVTYNVGRLW
jgi:hypothetical protein